MATSRCICDVCKRLRHWQGSQVTGVVQSCWWSWVQDHGKPFDSPLSRSKMHLKFEGLWKTWKFFSDHPGSTAMACTRTETVSDDNSSWPCTQSMKPSMLVSLAFHWPSYASTNSICAHQLFISTSHPGFLLSKTACVCFRALLLKAYLKLGIAEADSGNQSNVSFASMFTACVIGASLKRNWHRILFVVETI